MNSTLAANVITDAVRTYARKRARSSAKNYSKARRFRGVVSKLPSTYKFTRMVSTGQSGVQILVGTNTTGTTSFLCGATAGQGLSMSFSLDALRINIGGTQVAAVAVPAYTELGALFDKYRLEKVDIYYTSSVYSNGAMGSAQALYMPGCAYAVDTDDANNASVTDLQQFANCKYTQFGGDQGRMKRLASFKPLPTLGVYTNSTTVNGAGDLLGKSLFLDAASPSIQHYGFKMALDQLVVGTAGQTWYMVNFQVKYHLTMKDVR